MFKFEITVWLIEFHVINYSVFYKYHLFFESQLYVGDESGFNFFFDLFDLDEK